MGKVEIKKIPEHIVYRKKYSICSYDDFFNEETGYNILEELEAEVISNNPGVEVPKIPNDYNYFVHVKEEVPKAPMEIHYCDMVNKKGKDTEEYKFVHVPEITAATMMHKGEYNRIHESYQFLFAWIKENGYVVAGDSRSSAIDGPWNRKNREDYLTEIQIPIIKRV